MYRPTVTVTALCLCVQLWTQVHAQDSVDLNIARILQLGLEVKEQVLQLRYEIHNDSPNDIWICQSMDVYKGNSIEVLFRQDDAALLVRRCLDVPLVLYTAPKTGRYVRLCSGGVRRELLSLVLPVSERAIYGERNIADGIKHASRVILQIGYYEGKLPERVLRILDPREPMSDVTANLDREEIQGGLGGPREFTWANSGLSDRDEEVLIGYTFQALNGEKLLQHTVEGVHLGCVGQAGRLSPPDLTSCTRMEFRFTPSALEFYFPHAAQRSLLSPSERQALQSLTATTIEDPGLLKVFVADLRNGREDAFITQEGMVDIDCYHGDEHVASLILDGDASLLTDKGQVFTYWGQHGTRLASMRRVTPLIDSLTARVDCANNLRDLWCWVDVYRFAAENTKRKYPPLAKWSDAVLFMYPSRPVTRPWFQCPGANDGKFHYALNATCEPYSPPDTVLLFETKAGWNQYGGPELFTFDNHDPKGGCVLLNDGTVKFIRTEEELRRLRWKP